MVLEVVKPSPSSTSEDVGALAAKVALEPASWLHVHMLDQVDLQESMAARHVNLFGSGKACRVLVHDIGHYIVLHVPTGLSMFLMPSASALLKVLAKPDVNLGLFLSAAMGCTT